MHPIKLESLHAEIGRVPRINWLSRFGPLVHQVIKDEALWTVSAQIAPAAINRGLRSNPKPPFTSVAIYLLLAHNVAISFDSVNLCLGFFPLDP
jgi:hypothetical protein